VKFERYAFDLSRFAGGPQVGAFGVRERNLWDVAFPDPNDPVYKQVPTHFRAELHDRLAAPIYPIAFTVLCFAILGAPRTSRQSREMSIVMTVVLIGALRMIGFACNVLAAQIAAIYVLWGSLLLAFGRALCDRARRRDRAAGIPHPACDRVFERMSQRLQPA
jgi:lipopolysaccharide export system permease protein